MPGLGSDADGADDLLTPLLTAAQAYPAFERMVLQAEERVAMCFRIFDPRTALRSPEARAIGETWVDLIAHTLSRGVRLDITLSDFEAVVRPDYHARATRCHRLIVAAGEISGRPELLRVRAALHPARIGWLPALVLWPRARGYLLRTAAELNAKTPAGRARARSELPALEKYWRTEPDGTVALRRWKMPRLTPVTHHQKLAVADGKLLYIGGLDLNERRYDTTDHARPASETWHDLQVLLRGPGAAPAETHLDSFVDVTLGKPAPKTPGLLRTVSRARRSHAFLMSPIPVLSELARAHAEAIDGAERLIYLETQFFRDTRLARRLARRARARRDLRLILILPARPDDVAFQGNSGHDARYGEYLQAKCIEILRRGFGDRLFIGSPAQHRKAKRGEPSLYGAPLIYLHAKLSIFDDTLAIVSSANLNGRSFYWDTEAGVPLTSRIQIEDLRRQCYAHWLRSALTERFVAHETAVEAWRGRARENVRRAPADRRGYILPYASGPARRFGRNLPGIPEEMV
ncbi:phospholipase D-like domain-containing protein [Jannaschia marina]|uniref:phospholipase D-like domain-containing protein n=1 Tax=Jannaschia marina TaxID=2741674 RepID=UPI0015C798F2|nr:phospholipase D-like domain-containing protein [Jannaschia marina]